ncbi:MAG: hypothetical protein IJZ45_08175 [Bacteroidaceae bacterium]|nr:hypothetical protein [Bacteroidaceae bacterium]
MFSPILLLAGRFLLASALLMALYWVVWRKQATYRAKRMYLLTMPIVALAISLLQVEVYKPEPVVVEVMSGPTGPNEPIGPSPIPSQGRGVDTAPIMNLPIENEANSASLSEGQGISLPPLGEGKGRGPWGPWGPETPWNLALLLYALIILLFCIPFVVNLVLVRHLRKEASGTEEEKETGIRILTDEGVQAPFSFHRTIFLPVNLTETQRRMILAHERAHILHRHYVDVWVAEGITRLLWFNPFLWWARQELRNVHEFEADSNVLATGEDVYAYQAILIEEVLHGDIVIANGFNHSFIRRRFVEMLQSTNHRMTSLAKAGTAAWILLVVALMCCTVGEAETVYKIVTSDELQATSSQGEEAAFADSGQWVKAKAIEPKDYLPQVMSQLGNEHTGALLQLISTINSIREINNEQYEALKKTYPAGKLPSLDSINSNVRELKGSLKTIMLEGMTGLQTGLHKRLTELLHSSGLDTLKLKWEEEPQQHSFTVKGNPTFIDAQGEVHEYSISDYDTTFTVEALSTEEVVIDTSYTTQNKTWTFVKKPHSSQIIPSMKVTEEELTQMKIAARRNKAATNTSANEPAITNDASLREQDEALKAFFRGWFDMNKMAQKPVMTEKDFQQALKTEPIPPGTIPTYEEYQERRTNNLKAALLKMEDGRARLNKELRPQVEAVLKQHGKLFPPERQLKIVIKAAYKNATWEFENNTHPNAYGYALNTNFEIVDNPSSPDYNKGKASATPQTRHIQKVHLPTAPFTYSEYLQLTPKYHLVRYADETHLVCYECPKSDKEIISLHREMYLTDTATGDKYMLRRVQGIANDVQSVEVNNYREVPLQVTYVFPPLGSKVKEVTLNFPHKENQTYKVKSLEKASIKTIRDKALQAACTHPVEKSDKPDNSAPTLKRPKAAGYNVQDENSFPAYTDVYTTYQQVFHNDKDHYRIYRGKGCTYVTVAYKVRWEWEFFNFSDDMMLIDPKTGDRYMIAGVEHFPLDTHFWVVGQQGEYIRFVLVFPALPEKVTTVDLFEGGMQRRHNTDGARRYQGLTVRNEYTSPDREKQGRVIY